METAWWADIDLRGRLVDGCKAHFEGGDGAKTIWNWQIVYLYSAEVRDNLADSPQWAHIPRSAAPWDDKAVLFTLDYVWEQVSLSIKDSVLDLGTKSYNFILGYQTTDSKLW